MRLFLSTLGAVALHTATFVAGLDLTITNKQTVAIPQTLGGGYMWEDINHSGDGGLYAELLQNRAFQKVKAGTPDALSAWKANGTTISVVDNVPGVSSALPNSLSVVVPSNPSGTPGFMNTGYWGIKIQAGWTYTGSFYATSPSYKGAITVSLKSSTGTVYATAKLTTPRLSSKYQKYSFTFKPSRSAPDVNNVFTVELDSKSSAGTTVYFGMFTLFPPTYKNRPNGMRIDLAEAMAGTSPGVWRFPGGNNLEGETIDTRWKWNETIGPLENRPGRMGDWGYINTDGLGLIEYLNWAEDLNATVILGVYSGYSLTGQVVPQDQLQAYVDDAIAEIQFVTSPASANKWGALRASLGRKEPYKVDYIEIGNEDNFAQASYQSYRWNMFVTQLKAQFPDKHFLATSLPSAGLTPAYTYIDYHNYNIPSWFESASFMFDDYPRNNTKYFVGEYAVISTNASDVFGSPATGRLTYPTIQGAVAEAAFMTGMERNADVVFAAAYAPTLQNVNSYQWTPDIISFDANTLVKSASYYAQQMFGKARGTNGLTTSPVSDKAAIPLYWSASINLPKKQVILKIVNAGNSTVPVNASVQYRASTSTASVVSLSPAANGDIAAYNTLTNPNVITPKTSSIPVSVNSGAKTSSFSYSIPGHSVAVITMGVH